MDFLDPRKRRAHHIRLMIGYGLMAVAIVLTATILVYWAYGYGFNTKTGGVVENGLLFVDSKPGGATIYLNGQNQNETTSARMVLTGGAYDLSLKKDGYIDWQRRTTVSEHSVLRMVYPFLFPKEPKTEALKSYSLSPAIMTASPDRRWLLLLPQNGQVSPTFEMFDTDKPNQSTQAVSIPTQLLNGAGRPGSSLSVIGWANDNDRLLLKHAYDGGLEFIIFNRANPAASVNLNRLFNFNPTDIALVNKKIDQVYLYGEADNALLLGDINRANLQPLLKRVLNFKSLDNNLLLYVTDQEAAAGQVLVKIWDNGKSYQLTTLPAGSKYLIQAAQFQSHWYYVASSDQSKRINIYKDPLDGLKDPARAVASPFIALINSSAENVAVSNNSRFIAAQRGQRFAVYDIESQTRYQVSLPLTTQNQRKLVPSLTDDILFDGDFNRMFNLVTATDGKSTILQLTDLRAGVDLPK